MGVSEDDTDQGDDKSTSESHSWESITNSGPKSVTGDDCLMCSDTEDVAVKSTHRKFHRKAQASCSPAKQSLWKDDHLGQIWNNHKPVLGSDYKTIKTEWDVTLDRDSHSFEISGMTVYTNQLLWIKVATNARNIYTREHKTNIDGMKKALVQSLKQFHAHYYWLYEKTWPTPWWVCRAFTGAMISSALVSLLACHSNCSAPGVSNWMETETITIHLCEVHYQMAFAYDICQHDWAKHLRPSVGMQREAQQRACGGAQKGSEVSQVKKSIQIIGTEGSIMLSRLPFYVFVHSYSLLPSQPSEWMLIPSLNDSTFFSQMVPHCIFKWCLTQSDKLCHPFC